MLITANENHFSLHNLHLTEYTMSTTITMKADNISWMLTGVYGPQQDQDKLLFLKEIKGLKDLTLAEWLVVGDFNLIYKVEDKSNSRLDRRMMNYF